MASQLDNFINIKVIGVGGGGNNAVIQMAKSKIKNLEYIIVNTEKGILEQEKVCKTLQIGKETTKGLGAGANPNIGELAAKESMEEIGKMLEGTDLLFLTAGMGGGTGTGAIPVIAEEAKKRNILTIGVVTKPFAFEGKLRGGRAELGIEKLKPQVNALIVISNDNLLNSITKSTSIMDAFTLADDTLKQAIEGITDLINTVGTINVDFADIQTTLSYTGLAYLGMGESKGENKILEATVSAINNPLTKANIDGAKGVIINIKGGEDIGLEEINRSVELINERVSQEANIIFGTVIDESLRNTVVVTVIATGVEERNDIK